MFFSSFSFPHGLLLLIATYFGIGSETCTLVKDDDPRGYFSGVAYWQRSLILTNKSMIHLSYIFDRRQLTILNGTEYLLTQRR